MSVSSGNGEASAPAAYGGTVLGVHVLTEFIYCPRAGLVALGQEAGDGGEDGRPGRLDYLPRYDLRNIENALERTLRRLGVLAGALVAISVLSVLLMLVVGAGVLWIAFALNALLLVLIGRTLVDFVRLVVRRRAAVEAVGREPEFTAGNQPVPIDWWQLRSAGFTAARYELPLKDEELGLSGRPYLVLYRGDVCVPVFRQHHPTERLYRQHFARMAAYCHLIQRCTGFRAPYGVILFGSSYQGVAVAYSESAERAFRQGVLDARQVIRKSRIGEDPPAAPESLCRQCAVGRPRKYQPGVTETRSHRGWLPAQCAKDREGRLYHSPCGDRFQWLPPHQRTVEKDLRREGS